MNPQRRTISTLFAFAFFASFLAMPAQAGTLFRAYLSAGGNDSNPCTLPQPCRLLPAALSAVVDGGEIWLLDSANYNTAPITINNQTVTILAVPGALGSILANGGNAINKTGYGTLTLRNLAIINLSGGSNIGVNVTGDLFELTVEDTRFSGLDTGISVIDSTSSGQGTFHIYRSTFLANNKAITIAPTPAVSDGVTGLIDHCVINGTIGWSIYATRARVIVTNSNITNGNYGIDAQASSYFYLQNTVISNQYNGVLINGGTVFSFGDNTNASNRVGDIAGGSVSNLSHF